MREIAEALGKGPIIASVKDEAGLRVALNSPVKTVFCLFGDITSLPSVISRIKKSGRHAFVNLDMVEGLAQKPAAVEYIRKTTRADGVLTTKANVCRAASDAGLHAILRFFMVDSFAYHQLGDQIRSSHAEALEILPGCIPRVISWVKREQHIPMVAGGLVCDALDVQAALRAGVYAVATSNVKLWGLGQVKPSSEVRQLPPLTQSPGRSSLK